MRSYRTLIILAVLSVALAVPVCTTLAGPKPKAVVDAGVIAPAVAVFPGTKYDNIHTQEALEDGATGSFTVNQAASAKFVVVQVAVDGLLPSSTYRVYFDQNGITAGNVATAGPCILIGTLTTDATGYAEWYYETPDLAVGTYQWSVYINKIGYKVNHTVLISDNLDFQIEP